MHYYQNTAVTALVRETDKYQSIPSMQSLKPTYWITLTGTSTPTHFSWISHCTTAQCSLGLGLGMKRHLPQTSTSQRRFCASYKMVKKEPASLTPLH